MARDFLESLDFSNIQSHPTNSQYNVYRFYIAEQADLFESLLKENQLEYERHDEQDTNKNIYYFAVPVRLEKEVMKLNNLAIGKYRDPFIPNRMAAFVMIAVSIAIVVIAIVGYFKAAH